MGGSVSKVEIQTLGRFRITVDGKQITNQWPDETLKVLFCSLLSPLDILFTWDRICRSMLGVPDTSVDRHKLEELSIQPLNHFLINELGFNPIISGTEGICIDQQSIHLDAFEFHSNALEGLRLLSLGNFADALEKLSISNSIYLGCFCPGLPGKIIENTRKELEFFYQSAVMQARREIIKILTRQHLPV